MTLWDVMVVNNWQVIMNAYSTVVGSWAIVYFVLWWLVSVIIVLNIFTAFIVENFQTRVDQLKILQMEASCNADAETSAEVTQASHLSAKQTSVVMRQQSNKGHQRFSQIKMVLSVHALFPDELCESSTDDLRKAMELSPYLQQIKATVDAKLSR